MILRIKAFVTHGKLEKGDIKGGPEIFIVWIVFWLVDSQRRTEGNTFHQMVGKRKRKSFGINRWWKLNRKNKIFERLLYGNGGTFLFPYICNWISQFFFFFLNSSFRPFSKIISYEKLNCILKFITTFLYEKNKLLFPFVKLKASCGL